MIAPVATIGTVLGGVMLVMLLALIAHRGRPVGVAAVFAMAAIFCFATGRWFTNLAARAVWADWDPEGAILAGGLPLRAADGLIFVFFIGLALWGMTAIRKALE